MKQLLLSVSLLLATSSIAQNALHFDGTNDYVQTTYAGILGTANRTFEAWVYVSSGVTSSNAIIDYGTNAVGSRNTFNITSSYSLAYISGGTNANISSSANAVSAGQWNHVAFVLNNGTGYLYVNGLQVGTGSLTTVNTPSGNTNVRIGERVAGGNIPFSGKIDEVRIWDYARTQTEIQASMNSEFCAIPTGLVAYFKFNQGVAGGTNTGLNTALNASGSNNGTLTNFALSGSNSNWVTGKSLSSGSTTPGNTSITVCDSYTANTGAVWTTSGNYVDTISSATGCDSIVNIALTINQSSTGSLTTTACNKYVSPSGSNVWTTSGTYTDVLTNAVGCDSVLTINLTVNTVDTSVLQNGIVLTSWATGATYQWLDCGNGYAPVAGATNQTFTPTANGSYAVQLDNNGCMDTSACYTVTGIGFEESNAAGDFIIFPNPATDVLNIAFVKNTAATEITLLDLSGRALVTQTVEENSAETNISVSALPAGLYLLKLNKDGKSAVFRIEVM